MDKEVTTNEKKKKKKVSEKKKARLENEEKVLSLIILFRKNHGIIASIIFKMSPLSNLRPVPIRSKPLKLRKITSFHSSVLSMT
jgi:hypothetical protein